MKKIIFCSLLVAGATVGLISLSSCGTDYDICFVTTGNKASDGGYNQACYDKVVEYSNDNKLTYGTLTSKLNSLDSYKEVIKSAVDTKAEVVILMGNEISYAAYEVCASYPNTSFFMIDGYPCDADGNIKTVSNVFSLYFAEEQSGYLAGYSIVKEGYTKHTVEAGSMTRSCINYGLGYIYGANDAAKEMGLESGTIDIRYVYRNTYSYSSEEVSFADTEYDSHNREVIYAPAGNVVRAVYESAAQRTNKVVVGADIDHYALGKSMLTSSCKALAAATEQGLVGLYENSKKFVGNNQKLTISDDALFLPIATSRFKVFTADMYTAFYNDFQNRANPFTVDISLGKSDQGFATVQQDCPYTLITYVK